MPLIFYKGLVVGFLLCAPLKPVGWFNRVTGSLIAVIGLSAEIGLFVRW